MTFKKASKTFDIPLKALRFMQEDGLISYPLSEDNITNLAFLRYIWNKDRYIKLQLSSRSMKQKMLLVQNSGITKTEAYILNRYLNKDSKKLFVKQVADELHSYYKISITKKLYNLIHKIRRKAYYLKEMRKVNLPLKTGEKS